jgi:hypothetical protein
MVVGFDRSKKPNFSVKARQLAEEKEAVEAVVPVWSEARRFAGRKHPRRGPRGQAGKPPAYRRKGKSKARPE